MALFFKKQNITVDSIVADLASKITQLEDHAVKQTEVAAAQQAAIEAATAAKAAAEAEHTKAKSVAAKIRALVS